MVTHSKKMNLITHLTKVLQYFPGELSHFVALKGLKIIYSIGLLDFFIKKSNSQNNSLIKNKLMTFGNFKNSLGIAAGLDKNAEYVDCLAALDIGFIEVGTVTPRPQPGNPKPRICLLYTSPSPRDVEESRMPSSA